MALLQTVLPAYNSGPYLSVVCALIGVTSVLLVVFLLAFYGPKPTLSIVPSHITDYIKFAYSCFLKPHDANTGRDQKVALESFYKAQASIYDRTRRRLLQGREDMLALVAAQVEHKLKTGKLRYRGRENEATGGLRHPQQNHARPCHMKARRDLPSPEVRTTADRGLTRRAPGENLHPPPTTRIKHW